MKKWMIPVTCCLLVCFLTATVTAQPGWRPGPRPPFGPPPPPPPHHHHGPSDFDKTMRVLGAVGAVAAIAGGYTPYTYYRQPRPVVVVPAPPRTVVVTQPAPVVVEKQVIVEKQVPVTVTPNDYSEKLGASFIFQKMQIPGYSFTGARLITNPVSGSPLNSLGLEKGDVITRLDNEPAVSLDVLNSHIKDTAIRYIKSGTTRVQLGRIYIPADTELIPNDDDVRYAP